MNFAARDAFYARLAESKRKAAEADQPTKERYDHDRRVDEKPRD